MNAWNQYPWYNTVIETLEGLIEIYGNPERFVRDLRARYILALKHGFARRIEVVEIPDAKEKAWQHGRRLNSWEDLEGLKIVSDLLKEKE